MTDDVTIKLNVDTRDADAQLARLEARARDVGTQRGGGAIRQRLQAKQRAVAGRLGTATPEAAAIVGGAGVAAQHVQTAPSTSHYAHHPTARHHTIHRRSLETMAGAAAAVSGGHGREAGTTAAENAARPRRGQAAAALAAMRRRMDSGGAGLAAARGEVRRIMRLSTPGGLVASLMRFAPGVGIALLAKGALDRVAEGADERIAAQRTNSGNLLRDIATGRGYAGETLRQIRDSFAAPVRFLHDIGRDLALDAITLGEEIFTRDPEAALANIRRYRLAARSAELKKAKAEAEPTIAQATQQLAKVLSDAGRFESPQRTRSELEGLVRQKVYRSVEDQVSGIKAAPLRQLGHQGGD